ncbi:transcriptional regulator with XRE-family HTH domain [Actinoplanes lutulentus]|uniref:Helix-turn-helix protein n=1 Tax=Actinoplanes lutulentus TaxID=1287878 RepID=A0A327Z0Y5_9ACTN|nr:helix-turn-helix transcriptional regulator [Actinoplanes lutulentus]MBB2948968.1 transcriptional regulator with XRE-family HTH domain [Actinoplanes lutulentus]RAK26249.1 helix-turn-helix protein [Actinoplanes lutulentus]
MNFASLLRAWRDRLQPGDAGIPVGQRRTRGLRREEVAMLAGLSVDYLVQLEQGRADHPSEQVVAALARVLQLSDRERDQLFVAAGLPAPLPRTVPTHIPDSVSRMVARMSDAAVGVYTSYWRLLTANPAWEALLGEAGPDRNLIREEFAGSRLCAVRTPAEREYLQRALVSDLRATHIRYPEDPAVLALITELENASEPFARMWADGVLVEDRSKLKTFEHPVVGSVTLDCDIFTVVGTDLRILAYTAAPGTEDAARFERIRQLSLFTSVG